MPASKKRPPPAEPRVVAALAASPLFAGLRPAEVAKVAELCRWRAVARGGPLFVEGVEAEYFYVVASGQFKVFKTSPDGREVIIKVMRKGDMVGEAAALAGRTYPASARAVGDAEAAAVPRRPFVALLHAEPALALNMIAALSERLHQVNAVLERHTLKEVPGRLAAFFLANAERGADGTLAVELKTTKADLAAELGTVPETLSRAIRKFADAGFIRADEKRVILADEESLRKLADGLTSAAG
jgi:CRP/FNR family transcriptional regulator